MRFIAISATIPNIQDLSEWLNVPEGSMLIFGNEYRSIQLEKHVLDYPNKKNEFLFGNSLNFRLLSVIRKYS